MSAFQKQSFCQGSTSSREWPSVGAGRRDAMDWSVILWSSAKGLVISAILAGFTIPIGYGQEIERAGTSQRPSVTRSEAFREQSERLRSLVYARPRATATFDRWFQLYAQAGAKDELKNLIDGLRRDHATDPSATQVAGLLYEQLRDWPVAEAAWQDAHRLAPDDYFPLVRLAGVQLRLARLDEAAASFEAALQLKMPQSEYTAHVLQLVTLYQRQAEPAKAADWLRELGTRAGANAAIQRDVAQRYQQLGMLAEARDVWLRIADQPAADASLRYDAQLQAMQLSHQLGEVERATSIGRSLLLQVDPQGSKATQLRQLIARQLEQQGGAVMAASFWESFCKEHPEDVRARAAWADALARTGDNEQSRAIYRELLVRAPKDVVLRQAYLERLIREGDFEAAAAQLEELMRLDPTNVDWLMQLAEVQLREAPEDVKEAESRAVASWRRAVQLKPRDAHVARDAAEKSHAAALGSSPDLWNLRPRDRYPAEAIKQRTPLWAAAESFYREALRRDPTIASRRALATFLHRLGREQDATAVWLDPNQEERSSNDWLEAAEHLSQLGYTAAAQKAAEKSVEAQSTNLAAWDQWLELTLNQPDFELAMQRAQQMLAVRPQDPAWKLSALDWRVRITVAARKVDARLAKLDEFIRSRPQDRDAVWERILLLQATGQLTVTDPLVARWIQSPPGTPAERLRWADVLRDVGQLEEASKLYRESLEKRGPQRKMTLRRLVETELQDGDLAGARAAAETMAQELPRDAEAQLLLVAVADRQSDGDTQLEVLERAARAIPRDVTVRRQYANVLQQRGRVADAIQQALAALDQTTSLQEKQSLLAWMLPWVVAPQDRAAVRQHLESQLAQASDAKQAELADCLTFWLERTGDVAAAQHEMAAQFLQRPLDVDLLQRLVDVSDRAGKLDDAIRYQRQLAILRPSPTVQERLAQLYRQNGQTREALEIWDRITNYRGTELEALQLIDELLERPDLLAAQRLTEAALSRYPSSWRLGSRAALLHVALAQPAAAGREITRLLRIDVASSEPKDASPDNVSATVERLEWAVTVDLRLRVARWKQLQAGRQREHELPRLFSDEIRDALRDETVTRTQVLGALIAHQWRDVGLSPATLRRWALEPNASQSLREAVVIADWLQGEGHESQSLLRLMLQQQPTGSLPHLLPLLRFGELGAVAAASRAEIATSLAWVEQQAPSLAHDLRSLVATRAAHSPADAERDEWIAARLRESPSVTALARWITPLQSTSPWPAAWHSVICEQLERSFESESLAIASAQEWQAILSLSLDEEDAIPQSDEKRSLLSRATLAYLKSPEVSEEDPIERDRRARRSGPFLSPNQREKPKATFRELRKSLLALASLEGTLRDENVGNLSLGEDRPFLERAVADDLRRLLEDPHRAVADRTIRYTPASDALVTAESMFPASDDIWSSERLNTLHLIASRLQTSDVTAQDEFLAPWRAAGTIRDAERQEREVLAPAYMLWWWNRREESLQQLQDLVKQHPDVAVFRWNYVRALLQSDHVSEAYSVLSDRADETSAAPEPQRLRQLAWQLWSRQLHHEDLSGHEGAVTSLAMQPHGTHLASVGVDGKLRIWDVPTGTLRHTLEGHGDMIMAVQFSPDGKTIYSGGYDRTLRRWDAEKGLSLAPLGTHPGVIRALACSLDGQFLASGDDTGQVRVVDVTSGETRFERSHASPVHALSFLENGDLAALSQDGQLRIWKPDGTERTHWSISARQPRAMVRSSPGERLWIAAESGEIECWQPASPDTSEWTQVEKWEPRASIRGLAFAPQSATLAAGSDDQLVRVWQVSRSEERFVLQGHTGRVLAVALTEDGAWLASAGLDGMIKIWKLPSP